MKRIHEPASNAPPDVVRHYLGDLIYGANDGLVTTLAIVGGVAGASLPPSIILILGVVNLAADGFSMGASNYLAIRSGAAADGRDRGIREPLVHATVTFAAFVVVGFLPLIPYLIPGVGGHAFGMSFGLTGVVLFGIGAGRSLVVPRPWFRSGLEMFLVGAVAAGAAYGAGAILARWIGA